MRQTQNCEVYFKKYWYFVITSQIFMKENENQEEKEEIRELLRQYNNFKNGKRFTFIEEESFQRLISYFDENDNLLSALEAANFAIDQFPYSASLFVKKADILIATQN